MDVVRRNAKLVAVGICMTVMFGPTGCNSEGNDWKKAEGANTIQGYKAFLEQHANGKHAGAASAAMERIEDSDWKRAQDADKIDEYKAFLAKYPGSKHLAAAHAAIDLTRILQGPQVEALRTFVSDANNEGALRRFMVEAGGSITLPSQPGQGQEGYHLFVRNSTKPGEIDIAIVIPTDAKLDLAPFHFAEQPYLNVTKGKVILHFDHGKLDEIPKGKVTVLAGARIKLVDNQMKLDSGSVMVPKVKGNTRSGKTKGEVTLSLADKDSISIGLASEIVDLAPGLLVRLSDTEFIVTQADGVSMKRELSTNAFHVIKGRVFHFVRG